MKSMLKKTKPISIFTLIEGLRSLDEVNSMNFGLKIESFGMVLICVLVLYLQPNAISGMGVADESKTTFLELQRKKTHRYVVFKIDESKKEVVVEKTGNPTESYDDFLASLPDNDCRYAVYDFDFVTSENCQKSKIFFFAWLV